MLSAVLIAAVSNLDNLAVGVAFGVRGTRISATSNVIIAMVTMAGTAGAIASGHALSRLMPTSVASALGSSIIIGIGAATILASLRTVRDPARPSLAEGDRLPRSLSNHRSVSHRKALALGVALALNNVGSGVGAGVMGIPPFATTMVAGAFSLLTIGGGSRAGEWVGRLVLGRRASLAAGLLLVLVGGRALAGVG